MILSYPDLLKIAPSIVGATRPAVNREKYDNELLVNPASIDICLGEFMLYEKQWDYPWWWRRLYRTPEASPTMMRQGNLRVDDYLLRPGEFVLVETLERIRVPDGYAIDLRLKSTSARQGFDHALAFWVDPGWDGYLTMEVKNNLKWSKNRLRYGQPFAQIIVHQLSSPVGMHSYRGRYQHASTVQGVRA